MTCVSVGSSISSENTEGGSNRVTSFTVTESDFVSDAFAFETLRVLYLCTFLCFTLNFVLTLYLVLCLFAISIALLHLRTLLLLGVDSQSTCSCSLGLRVRLLPQEDNELSRRADSRQSKCSSSWCSVSRLPHESTKSAVVRSSEMSPSALSWIALAMQRCFANS